MRSASEIATYMNEHARRGRCLRNVMKEASLSESHYGGAVRLTSIVPVRRTGSCERAAVLFFAG
jgi:hypothetical protein